jgi:adenine-specific DNA-methyltransferase
VAEQAQDPCIDDIGRSYVGAVTEQLAPLWEPESRVEEDFRPIHYLGSKIRLLDAIQETVDDVNPNGGCALDLFSGSGVVARRLLRSRDVVAVDIQQYARVLAEALFAQVRVDPTTLDAVLGHAHAHAAELLDGPLGDLVGFERSAMAALAGDAEPLASLVEHGSILVAGLEASAEGPLAGLLEAAHAWIPPGPDTVLTRFYGGVYFSYEQAATLDGLAAAARSLDGELGHLALAAVLSAASELVCSVGNQFAQPIRPRAGNGQPKRSALTALANRRRLDATDCYRVWVERYRLLAPSRRAGKALCVDYRQAFQELPSPVSVIYADPPYTRDHYSRFYHVLETITLGDEPEVSTVVLGGETQLSRGLYRSERHQSPFCIKSKAPGAFNTLFELARTQDVPLVLSYSPYGEGGRPRLMTVEQICALASEHYADVDVRSAGRVAHSKLNADRLNAEISYDAEVLVVCRP